MLFSGNIRFLCWQRGWRGRYIHVSKSCIRTQSTYIRLCCGLSWRLCWCVVWRTSRTICVCMQRLNGLTLNFLPSLMTARLQSLLRGVFYLATLERYISSRLFPSSLPHSLSPSLLPSCLTSVNGTNSSSGCNQWADTKSWLSPPLTPEP